MRQAVILLMAIAIVLSLSFPAAATAVQGNIGGGRKSRFLAKNNNETCSIDPSVCFSAGKPRRSCCSDQCVDTSSDSSNCGKCGNLCMFTEECCGGECVHLAFDEHNCGSCFTQCKKECVYGLCDYA